MDLLSVEVVPAPSGQVDVTRVAQVAREPRGGLDLCPLRLSGLRLLHRLVDPEIQDLSSFDGLRLLPSPTAALMSSTPSSVASPSSSSEEHNKRLELGVFPISPSPISFVGAALHRRSRSHSSSSFVGAVLHHRSSEPPFIAVRRSCPSLSFVRVAPHRRLSELP
ncbi:hypothetical protein TorRG33x02_066250 [Trema orientale]|uniref:Uncharacterized protein n=1 Tax=Trema orientale TaxID=63057 RepID=A0A2P5FIT5_TREOI|nr:hypothetical protein TorRG33x02_066250 [Trema orientale]